MKQRNKTILFIIALIFTSICLRGPIASLGSLIDLIEPDLGVSKGPLGFITTLPLLVFAASSLLLPKIANSIGHTRILVMGMLLLAVGCYVRTMSGYVIVLIGTFLVGVGISVGNVLISGIIKENMPLKIGLATGVYMCFQNLAATAGAGLSHPIAHALDLGWRNVLSLWTVPGIIATIAWIVFGHYNRKQNEEKLDDVISPSEIKKEKIMWTSKLAWSITIVMGTQSVNYYCVTAWLPSILKESDMSFQTAGLVASAFQLFAIPATFVAPIAISHIKSKSLPAVASGILYIIGILILLSTDSIPLILIALLFLASGGGASFAWVVAIIAMVSKDSHEATRLSGMSQSVGYLMAAIAPTLAGTLYEITDSWIPVMIIAISMSLLIITFSLSTGRLLQNGAHL